jgi:trimeric autotransporter adhesin
VQSNGNQLADLGSFTKTDGSSGTMGEVKGSVADINLATDTFHRQFTDHLDTSANLPDMQGSGAVRDLREAASVSADLAVKLAGLDGNTTRAELLAAMPSILKQWAASADFTDSFEAANPAGKDLFFIPPGVSALDAYNNR